MCELGLKFNKVPVDIQDKQDNLQRWYEKVNPELTVPALKYGDRTLADSKEMLTFLCEKHDESDLMPYDESRREKVNIYLNHFYTK